jgi:16S rRNA (uracil1498-N3)-methyltransferase
MRISRLYTPTPLNINQTIHLDDDNAHYVRTVLRLKESAQIVVFNGQGGEYVGTLSEVSRKAVRIHVEQFINRSIESNLNLILGLGISRGDRMDFSVQKAVELGTTQITPLCTARCVVQFNAEKKSQRLNHWQKIAQHAAEQSGRTIVPNLADIQTLPDWVSQPQGLKIFLDPYANTSLKQLSPEQNTVILLTGPEGGFTDEERQFVIAAGFIPVRLGQRILRTETASLAALAAVQMLWGDFS